MTYVQSAAANLKDASDAVGRHRWLVLGIFTLLMVASSLLIDKLPRSYKAGANVLVVNGNTRNDPTLSSPTFRPLRRAPSSWSASSKIWG